MKRAFTLVEMAIVLVIVGFIISMGIMGYAKMNLGEKYKLTKEQQSKMQKLIFIFAQINKRFPCPDFNGNGTEDYNETLNMCDSERYYKKLATFDINTTAGDMDYSMKKNIPPYLYPYISVGGIKNDAFTHPIRYDINFLLTKTKNLQTLCNLASMLVYNQKILNKNINDDVKNKIKYDVLPIVTEDDLSKDNEKIDTNGKGVAGVLISEGEYPGVSGVNLNSNMEYADDTVKISNEYIDSEQSYDDIVKSINYTDFLDYTCGGYREKNYNAIIEVPKNRCIEICDDSGCEQLTGSMLENIYGSDDSDNAISSMVFNFSTSTIDRILIYSTDDCSGDEYTTPAQLLTKDDDNDYFVDINASADDFTVEDKRKTAVFTIADAYYKDGGCIKVGNGALVPSVVTDADSEIELYSDASCVNSIDIDFSKMEKFDKNKDARVFLTKNGSDYEINETNYDYINITFNGNCSYLDKDLHCKQISDESKKFYIKDFYIFFSNDNCEFNDGEFFTMDQVLFVDMKGNSTQNDGRVKISEGSGLSDL
jgi:prepilin-type N-terminal cleavage/methylation domain-containing protein